MEKEKKIAIEEIQHLKDELKNAKSNHDCEMKKTQENIQLKEKDFEQDITILTTQIEKMED